MFTTEPYLVYIDHRNKKIKEYEHDYYFSPTLVSPSLNINIDVAKILHIHYTIKYLFISPNNYILEPINLIENKDIKLIECGASHQFVNLNPNTEVKRIFV